MDLYILTHTHPGYQRFSIKLLSALVKQQKYTVQCEYFSTIILWGVGQGGKGGYEKVVCLEKVKEF